jgi:serine protease AprX
MAGKKLISLILLYVLTANAAMAGINIVRSSGITLTGIDGIKYVGTSGITLTGVDSFLNYQSNGITLTGVDGITLTGVDGATQTGADGVTYTGSNGARIVQASGMSLTGADGITLTGVDGITLTGVDGTTRTADSIIVRQPDGITLTGVDGITLTGVDGLEQVGNDGITLTGVDGITLTGVDGLNLSGADSITGINAGGTAFKLIEPSGITLTGVDGAAITKANGITLTGVDGITLTGVDSAVDQTGSNLGLQSVDPDLALVINNATDDSNINAVIAFHRYPTQTDLDQLRSIGILGGTLYRFLPMVMVTTSRANLIAASHLAQVRSIYGNRTLNWNSDPFFKTTQIPRVATDRDLQIKNAGMPVSGRSVTVAVLDTGINTQHNDLAGKVVQNVRLSDAQSVAAGFINPVPVENLVNTDPVSGHGTFVAGIIAGSGVSSGGKYNGVAPGANLLGLSAGDVNLSYVLAGFDYLMEHGSAYNVRAVNCSFSSSAAYDENDPVNIATKLLTGQGINVVVSAGNTGAGNGTMNPYAQAPWVISVGATDEKGKLADFSSRGRFDSAVPGPTLVAPGVNVVSLRSIASQTGIIGLSPLGFDTQRLTVGELPFYTTASGTSFSTPQVAGAIAMMLEANPNLSPAEVKEILQSTTTALPHNYRHEIGAGMLNTHAAVLKSAFPEREMGLYRAVLDRGAVKFSSGNVQVFQGTAAPGSSAVNDLTLPADTVQADFNITWGLGPNDLGLKINDMSGVTRGASNNLNVPGISGRSERVLINYPEFRSYRSVVQHSAGTGVSPQAFSGTVDATRVFYADGLALDGMPAETQALVKEGVRTFIILPRFIIHARYDGFAMQSGVTRGELAAAILRAGLIPQYMTSARAFNDVKDLGYRNAIESAQFSPNGKLFFDAGTSGEFIPDKFASRLVMAVALVKAANLDAQAAGATLPLTVTDRNAIPAQWRGYAAIALQKGWLSLHGTKFDADAGINQVDLAQAVVKAAR